MLARTRRVPAGCKQTRALTPPPPPPLSRPPLTPLPQALTKLEDYGFIQSRPKGEYHANNQQMSKLLHKAIGLGGQVRAGVRVHFVRAQRPVCVVVGGPLLLSAYLPACLPTLMQQQGGPRARERNSATHHFGATG